MTTAASLAPVTSKPKNPPQDPPRKNDSPARPASAELISVDHGRIAQRAYEIWERQGWPEGQSESHWYEAEMELRHSQPD